MGRHCTATASACCLDCDKSCHRLDVYKAAEMAKAVNVQAEERHETLMLILNTLIRIERDIIAMKKIGTEITTHRLDKKGKLIPLDKAPTQVKQASRRKKNTVTGVRAAK